MQPNTSGDKNAYVAIADSLRDLIKQQVWQPGDKLPAERDLMKKFGVARMTIRSALDVLQFEGLITRRRGRFGGTFVRGLVPTLEISEHCDYTAQVSDCFDSVELTTLNKELLGADDSVAEQLGARIGEHTVFIERLGFADKTPYMLERIYVRAALVPGILEMDLDQSMRVFFSERWPQATIAKQVDTFIPAVTSGKEQNLLKLTRNTPVMKIVRSLYGTDGKKISYSEKFFRTDLINLQLTIR